MSQLITRQLAPDLPYVLILDRRNRRSSFNKGEESKKYLKRTIHCIQQLSSPGTRGMCPYSLSRYLFSPKTFAHMPASVSGCVNCQITFQMVDNHFTSFLSKQVRNMVVEIGIPHLKNHSGKCVYLSHRFTFNWDKIETILCISDGFCIHDQPSSWFIDKINKIWPIFIEAHSLYNCSPPCLMDIQDLYEWTSHPNEIEEYFNLFLSSDVSTTEAILFLTAVLERSLGNLFLLRGSNVPSLLRDLLSTTEIEIILGKIPVVFLQLLVGTPSALNLRNIAWHGFPRHDELYPHFVSTLFAVILSVGELLLERNIDFLTIPKRQQMDFSDVSSPDIFLNVKENCEEIFELFLNSDFIQESHFSYWKGALEHYKNKRFGRAVLLLLPQVEHMLRCLYCRINDCLEQMLTAESITLYTTLNEIMAESIINEDGMFRENKIINFLGESVMEMLQDLFVHSAGPRLRDKMSHGECNLKDIPEQLINQLISVIVVIEMKSEEQFPNRTIKKQVHVEMKNQVCHMCENYVTKFHPASLLKVTIRQCLLSLNMLSVYDTQHLNRDTDQIILSRERSELFCLIQEVLNNIQKNESYSCIESVSAFVVSLKIQTVFRHKSENEIVNILRQIMGNVEQICEQVMEIVQEKCSLYSQHLLRSRQRETFKRMLCLVPQLKDILFCITCIIVMCLQFVNNISSLSGKELENLSKFCRTILQFVQNIVSLTKRDKNRWLEIQMLSEKFCKIVIKNFNAPFFLRLVLSDNTQQH